PEVDHPLLIGVAEHVGVLIKDGPHRWPSLLLPHPIVVACRWHVDAEVFGIPSPEPVRVDAAQEDASDACHTFHASRLWPPDTRLPFLRALSGARPAGACTRDDRWRASGDCRSFRLGHCRDRVGRPRGRRPPGGGGGGAG